MDNKRILAGALLIALTATGAAFASTSTGTTSTTNRTKIELTAEQKSQFEEFKTLNDKVKNGETLTADEQTKFDTLKASLPQRGQGKGGFGGHEGKGGRGGEGMGMGFGPGMMEKLTDEEKTKLESMTDDEKKTFFETKRTENEAKEVAREAVIDKLLNGETLTDSDKTIVEEIKTQRAEMKAKKAEMEEIRTIMEKSRNGETLTADEQTKLDEAKAKMPQRHEEKDETNTGSASSN